MSHQRHAIDEEVVKEIVTEVLEFTTSHMDICAHYFEAAAWGLVASSALELAEEDPIEAANIIQRNADQAMKILRDPSFVAVPVVKGGKRLQ